jgi:hypothetical protein
MPRREARISPYLFSLLLHALVMVLVVTGLASPTDESAKAKLAELFPEPQSVNVRLVDASDVPEQRPAESTDLVSERDARAADQGPRDLPEGEAFNRGETSLPVARPGQGGRDDNPRSRESSAPAPAAARPTTPAGEERSGRVAERTPRAAERAGAAEGGTDPSSAGDLAAAADRSEPAESAAEPSGEASPASLGDSRLAMPRRDLTVPPTVAPPGQLSSPGTGRRGLPQVDNRLSRARFDGEFSLSTYAWDYAPYMTRLKKQIEDYTWTILPSAFWYGIAAWATQVRFTILPDGRLESVRITGHDGVLELRHVAPDAVTGSADFEPLPTGFPDPKLTIVGNFYFNEFPPPRDAAASQSPPSSGATGPPDATSGSDAAGTPGAAVPARAGREKSPASAGQGGVAPGDS